MALDCHTISTLAGADLWAFSDRVHMAKVTLPYAAGSGAGASVSATIPANLLIPGSMVLIGNLAAGVSASISGNTVTIAPTNSANTLQAGSLAVLIVG